MSKCDDETLNTIINRYLKRRNYTNNNQISLTESRLTFREVIANEYLSMGSYDHPIAFSSTFNSTKLDYLNNCNKCLDEFFNFIDQLNLDNEQSLSFTFSIFMHLFIDLFLNDLKHEAKLFFTNNQHKFNCFNQLKKPIEMLNNTIKTQQLDKRLSRIRNTKISITLYESDHKSLLIYLENESLSKNLHQIISSNFSFTILPDKRTSNRIKMKKLTTNNISNGKFNNEIKLKEFNNLFKSNGKLEVIENDDKSIKQIEINDQLNNGEHQLDKDNKLEFNRDDNSNSFINSSQSNEIKMEIDIESSQSNQCLSNDELEFDELINNLTNLKPQLPEVLTYKLITNDSHLCCADLRNDLKYACSGTENSELLIFPTDLKPIWETNLNYKSKWIDNDKQSELIEEKVESNNLLKPYSFYGHYGSIVDCKFIQNTNYLLTCSTDTNSILWNLNEKDKQSNYLIKKYYGHTQPIYSLDVNCLGTHFATGSKDYTSRLFCLDRSNLLRSFIGHQNSVNCVHFHPNSKYLATGSSDHSIRMWDVSLSNMVRVFNCQTEIYSLCYSTCGKYLASAGADKKIKIWDLTNGKLFIEFNSTHTKHINSLSFDSTSSILISSSIDQQINFWNFKSFKQQPDQSLRNEDKSNLLLNKNLLIKIQRAKFTHSDLLIAIGT